MALYRDTAVVLRSWKLGEADRILALYTRDNGKVRAVAKGVRKSRSRFGSRVEPGRHLTVQLYQGRGDLDTVTQVELVDAWPHLRDGLDRFARASAVLEAVDALTPDREPDERLYDLLVGALRTMDQRDAPLVLAGFFWKLLALEGVEPMLEACVRCGASEPLVAYDVREGGVLCAGCRSGVPISADALELLRMMLGGRLGAALARPVDTATGEVDRLAIAAVEHHLERRLRSLAVLAQT
jgi:DNA repair protein RecO (recombination protein O)